MKIGMKGRNEVGQTGLGLTKVLHGRDHAIFDADDAVSEVCDAAVVSDDGHCAIMIVRELAHEFKHGAAGVRIERSGGLIGKQDFWVSRKGAGQCHTLLLPSAEIRGKGGGFVVEVDLLKQTERLGASARTPDALEFQCDFDVFYGCKRRKEIESLEDEPDVIEPNKGQFALAEACDLPAGDLQAPGGGAENASHDGEKGGFAAAGWPHQEKQLASVQIELNALKSRDTRGSFGVDLCNSAGSNGYFHLFPRSV
jgi:hypothetical protein